MKVKLTSLQLINVLIDDLLICDVERSGEINVHKINYNNFFKIKSVTLLTANRRYTAKIILFTFVFQNKLSSIDQSCTL